MKTLLLSCLAILALCLAGCSTPKVGINTVSSSSGGTEYKWFAPDKDTRKHVFVESANTMVTEGGLTKVQVRLHNRGEINRAFNYIFEWQDENGFAVKSSIASMKTVRLAPNETITITSVAPKPTAVGYTLKLEKTN